MPEGFRGFSNENGLAQLWLPLPQVDTPFPPNHVLPENPVSYQ